MRSLFPAAVLSAVLLFSQFSFAATKSTKSTAGAKRRPAAAVQQPADNAAVVPDSAGAEAPVSEITGTADSTAATAAAAPAGPATAADFLKQGDLLTKKGQTEKAMEAYKQCVDLAAGDAAYSRAALALGKYYYGKKMYPEALPLLSGITGSAAEALPFKVMLATAQLAAGSADSAIALLEPIASNQKVALASRKEMFKIIGDAYLKNRDEAKAVVWYGKHLTTGGAKSADIAYLMAAAQEKTAPAKAKLAFEANVKAYPKDYRNYVRLGILNAQARATLPAALALLKKAVALVDTIPSIWIEIGKVNASLGKKEDEREAYRTCLRGDANNLDAKIRLGNALLDAGAADEAISYLEDAHKQAPDSVGPMVSLAAAYNKTGNPKKAIDLLVKIKTAQPKNIEVRKQLVEAYKATGQDQKASEEITGALEVERDPDLLLAGAQLYVQQNKAEDAVPLLEELLGMVPDNIDALMIMARVKRAQKKYDEAVEVFKEIGVIDPKYAPALYERAEMHLEENKVKWAEMFYQRALTADPQYALAEVGMAKLAALFKNRESCEEHLAKANVMAPDDPVVQKAIEEVRNPKRSSGGSTAGTTAPADERKGRRK